LQLAILEQRLVENALRAGRPRPALEIDVFFTVRFGVIFV
jgi:hypothetical protein